MPYDPEALMTLLEKTNATQSKLEDATTDLREAINALVKKVDDTARTEAINALNDALKAAEEVGRSAWQRYCKASGQACTCAGIR